MIMVPFKCALNNVISNSESFGKTIGTNPERAYGFMGTNWITSMIGAKIAPPAENA